MNICAATVQDFTNYANSFGTGFLKEHKANSILISLRDVPPIYLDNGRLNRFLDNALKMEGFNDAAISHIQEWLGENVLPQKTHHFHVTYKARNGRRVTRDFPAAEIETTEPLLRAAAISRFAAVGFVDNLNYVNYVVRVGAAPDVVMHGRPAKGRSFAVREDITLSPTVCEPDQ
jgi:hypothetical protein